ncbi:alpha/beta hydrolase [Bacillus velezensis]|uniref:alpha/beta hydrolase n=1 Tax=Bacillus velezensis TaxID=492670 RepID=UPI0018C5F2BE|nr:alpha/beta hydrolase-fold protein [Bacillus velezensis]QPK89096.1 alpha/beta hydrolase [Bacillus velezensis]
MRGTLTEHPINGRECTVYLPPSYSVQTGALPCVYVLDGGSLFLEQIDKLESQFTNGTLPELIFIGIKPADRLDEYTPWPAPSLSPAFHDFGGKGRLFLEELTNVIIPTVEDTHHIAAHPETRGLIGASLGGLFSIYAMLQKPEIFDRIGCISGSFWYEKSADYVRSAPLRPARQRIFMSVGSREAEQKCNIQNTMIGQNKEVHKSLRQKGFSQSQLSFTVEEGAVHHQEAFKRQFNSALSWLYGKNRSRD